jgi:hypothetical protein
MTAGVASASEYIPFHESFLQNSQSSGHAIRCSAKTALHPENPTQLKSTARPSRIACVIARPILVAAVAPLSVNQRPLLAPVLLDNGRIMDAPCECIVDPDLRPAPTYEPLPAVLARINIDGRGLVNRHHYMRSPRHATDAPARGLRKRRAE